MSLLELLTSFSTIILQPPKDIKKTIDELKQLFVYPAKDLGLAWDYLHKIFQYCGDLQTDYRLWFLWTIPEAMKSIQVLLTGKHYQCLERLLKFFMNWYCSSGKILTPQDPDIGLLPHFLILARTLEPSTVHSATLCMTHILWRCNPETNLYIQHSLNHVQKLSDLLGAKSFYNRDLRHRIIVALFIGLQKCVSPDKKPLEIHLYAEYLLLDELDDMKIAETGTRSYWAGMYESDLD